MFLRIVLMDVKQLQVVIDSIPPSTATASTTSSASDAPKSVKLAAQDSRVEVRDRTGYETTITISIIHSNFGLLFSLKYRHRIGSVGFSLHHWSSKSSQTCVVCC